MYLYAIGVFNSPFEIYNSQIKLEYLNIFMITNLRISYIYIIYYNLVLLVKKKNNNPTVKLIIMYYNKTLRN